MDESLEQEVQRRLEEVRRRPAELMRYDRNGDGFIDDEEWEEVRRVVTLEVQTERRRQQGQAEAERDDLSPLIGERFEVMHLLGRGAQGRTFLARDRRSGEEVALKELDLSQADDWKAIELFDREAQALRHLEHPGIPRYVDAFHQSDDEGSERFFLAQEFVEGSDFENLVKEGATYTEAEARDILRQVLEILVYLQERSPPVVHRDIKPSNLIRRPDGTVALIDFGAVQSVLPDSQGGSTIIGTSGYMPVEQLMGRAVPATDLYALGATAIHLLSRRHPAELPVERMALQFRPFVNISDRFADYLERLVEPHVEQRFPTARQALQALLTLDQIPQSPSSPTIRVVSNTGGEDTEVSVVPFVGTIGLLILVIMAAVMVPVTNCGRFSAKAMNYEDVMMSPLETCAIAEEKLGEDIRIPWLGVQNGSSQIAGGSGSANWTFPVVGNDRRGRYRAHVNTGSDGKWSLVSATLTIDGQRYDLMDCD